MSRTRRTRPGEGQSPPRTIFQYVEVLRDRWFPAAVAFVLVAGLVGLQALMTDPTFEAAGTIQLETRDVRNDELADLSLSGSRVNVDAELEVMTSHSVAARAAVLAGAGAMIIEEDGYRLWESLLRRLGDGGRAHRLSARLVDRPMPKRSGSFRLTFNQQGTAFTGEHVNGNTSPFGGAFDPASGAELTLLDETVRISPLSDSPAGRTFILTLRTEGSAAAWLQGIAFARQVGLYTGIIRLGVATDEPHVAKEMADALSRSYIAHRLSRKDEEIRKRITWLGKARAAEQEKLTKVLDARDAYVNEHGAILLSKKAAAAFEAQGQLFEQHLTQQQVLMEETTALEALRSSRTPERVMAAIGVNAVDVHTSATAASLAQLEVRRGSLIRQGNKEADPSIRNLDAEIVEVREMLAKRLDALRTEVEAQFERRIEAVKNRIAQIKQEVAKHDGVLADLPREERALAELTRNVEAAQSSFAFLTKLHGETELALSSTVTSAHLVDEALAPRARKFPVVYRRAIIALFLGLFAALAVALILHARDRTVRTPQDIEHGLGLQVFTAVPQFGSVPRRERKGLKTKLVSRDVPGSILAENYRTLRANIRFANEETPIQTLTITSALPGEGKTHTTLNLAIAMARAGRSVIVVDGDLRHPTAHTHFDLGIEPGFADVMLGEVTWQDALQETGVEGLTLLPAGRVLKDPSALLEHGHFEEMLAELRETYDYVLFDVPPALAVADAAAFFRSLDAVLLVCRHGRCPVDIVSGARERIERFGGRLLGAVFNGFDARRAGHRRYGYGGHHAYHGYYARHGYGRSAQQRDASETTAS